MALPVSALVACNVADVHAQLMVAAAAGLNAGAAINADLVAEDNRTAEDAYRHRNQFVHG
ncbi:MAG TPA: hypothetical protein VGJ95_20015 [Pseudonocardiaceae bacterium]